MFMGVRLRFFSKLPSRIWLYTEISGDTYITPKDYAIPIPKETIKETNFSLTIWCPVLHTGI